MRFDVITVFPQAFESYLNTSILKRARQNKKLAVRFHELRRFAKDKYRTIDDKPYGGGAGMVLMAEPILKAYAGIKKEKRTKTMIFSAKGIPFDQRLAYDWAKKYDQLIIISGRYEGIDERVVGALKAEEVSIGPYVLTDGDVAGMVLISAVGRLIPGVIKSDSLKEESHSNVSKKTKIVAGAMHKKGFEYPQYTRPEVLKYKGKTYRVPRILLSGDHKKIAEWRNKYST